MAPFVQKLPARFGDSHHGSASPNFRCVELVPALFSFVSQPSEERRDSRARIGVRLEASKLRMMPIPARRAD
jgi:hypothetical protein